MFETALGAAGDTGGLRKPGLIVPVHAQEDTNSVNFLFGVDSAYI